MLGILDLMIIMVAHGAFTLHGLGACLCIFTSPMSEESYHFRSPKTCVTFIPILQYLNLCCLDSGFGINFNNWSESLRLDVNTFDVR